MNRTVDKESAPRTALLFQLAGVPSTLVGVGLGAVESFVMPTSLHRFNVGLEKIISTGVKDATSEIDERTIELTRSLFPERQERIDGEDCESTMKEFYSAGIMQASQLCAQTTMAGLAIASVFSDNYKLFGYAWLATNAVSAVYEVGRYLLNAPLFDPNT